MVISFRRGRWIAGLLGLVALLGAARLASIDGLWAPIYVTGPSMAPTLWGPSRQVKCAACGVAIRVHEHPVNPFHQWMQCHNCGSLASPAEADRLPPDRVLIDRAAYLWRAPRHGELIAIKTEKGPLQVKRIIGTPGDEIGLHNSELTINGRRVEAVLPPQQIPLMTVFDAAFPDLEGPRWRVSEDGQWSVYHHRSVHDENRPGPIRDDYPANTAVSRQLMPVAHKQLAGRITAAEPVRIEVDIWLLDHWERFRGRFPAGDLTWSVSSLAAEGLPETTHPDDRWRRIVFSSSTEACKSPVSAETPIAMRVLQAQGEKQPSDARLRDLLISRHFHWDVRRSDQHAWPATPFRLQARRYFVVGDNLPISVDSRAEPQG
ncbi:MAG: S26 family signal peptidase, partial [Pirellulaceae bacterium]